MSVNEEELPRWTGEPRRESDFRSLSRWAGLAAISALAMFLAWLFLFQQQQLQQAASSRRESAETRDTLEHIRQDLALANEQSNAQRAKLVAELEELRAHRAEAKLPPVAPRPSNRDDARLADMVRQIDNMRSQLTEAQNRADSAAQSSARGNSQLEEMARQVHGLQTQLAATSQALTERSQAIEARPSTPANVPGHSVVRVFFGTDRAVVSTARDLEKRFPPERGTLSVGTVDVSVPYSHKVGEIERAGWSDWRPSPDQFFQIRAADTLNEQDYRSQLASEFDRLDADSAIVFVHGFNVTFEDAALRTAQIAYDLSMKSVPAFYSWPSQGHTVDYTVDEQMAEWTTPHLREFLERFADQSKGKAIYVIAHSMGSRPTVRALAALLAARPELAPRFKELILAAPDIDADVFKRDLMPPLIALRENVTLYASSADKALLASKAVHGAPRAGDADHLVTLAGVETLDASRIDTDFLGHSYVGNTRALLVDIAFLINANMRAAKRPFLERKQPENQMAYWVFKP